MASANSGGSQYRGRRERRRLLPKTVVKNLIVFRDSKKVSAPISNVLMASVYTPSATAVPGYVRHDFSAKTADEREIQSDFEAMLGT
jgi:hypothetical protein